MDVKVTAGSLFSSISDSEISGAIGKFVNEFGQQTFELLKQFASCQPTAQRTHDVENQLHQQLQELGRGLIDDQMSAKIGAEKLRKLVAILAGGMEPFREQAQVQKLLERMAKARQNKQKPVLSLSRDGVALGMAPWSFFEIAGVACISVLADGKKLGTVYLGCVPETNQAQLSLQLTSLLKATIRASGDHVPEIVYVSDAGKVERYLRRYRRFMDYAPMKSKGYPIGSGVVESACKQIVSERMKLSGMRWHKEGGQQTMTLRCLLLSGIWDKGYRKWLASKPALSDLIKFQTP